MDAISSTAGSSSSCTSTSPTPLLSANMSNDSSSPPQATYQRPTTHAYLGGNYAPVRSELPLTGCRLVLGPIPKELWGGQYVRNGGNPTGTSQSTNSKAHWFDGNGMLAGVFFPEPSSQPIQPQFINRSILTDVYRLTTDRLQTPIIPSIATLVDPSTTLWTLFLGVTRAFLFYALTWIPGLYHRSAASCFNDAGDNIDEKEQDRYKATRLSVANATIWYHDGKILTGCESGPPMRVLLPGLETLDWWTGKNEEHPDGWVRGGTSWWQRCNPLMRHFMEYTTAHVSFTLLALVRENGTLTCE